MDRQYTKKKRKKKKDIFFTNFQYNLQSRRKKEKYWFIRENEPNKQMDGKEKIEDLKEATPTKNIQDRNSITKSIKNTIFIIEPKSLAHHKFLFTIVVCHIFFFRGGERWNTCWVYNIAYSKDKLKGKRKKTACKKIGRKN